MDKVFNASDYSSGVSTKHKMVFNGDPSPPLGQIPGSAKIWIICDIVISFSYTLDKYGVE